MTAPLDLAALLAAWREEVVAGLGGTSGEAMASAASKETKR